MHWCNPNSVLLGLVMNGCLAQTNKNSIFFHIINIKLYNVHLIIKVLCGNLRDWIKHLFISVQIPLLHQSITDWKIISSTKIFYFSKKILLCILWEYVIKLSYFCVEMPKLKKLTLLSTKLLTVCASIRGIHLTK